MKLRFFMHEQTDLVELTPPSPPPPRPVPSPCDLSFLERSSRFSLGEVGAVESQSLQRVRVAPQARNGKLFRLA